MDSSWSPRRATTRLQHMIHFESHSGPSSVFHSTSRLAKARIDLESGRDVEPQIPKFRSQGRRLRGEPEFFSWFSAFIVSAAGVSPFLRWRRPLPGSEPPRGPTLLRRSNWNTLCHDHFFLYFKLRPGDADAGFKDLTLALQFAPAACLRNVTSAFL